MRRSRARPALRHHAKRHAAARTDEYLYSQLIPYIGNKRKLLGLIAEGLALTGLGGGTFVDLFSGSTVVARLAKSLGFRVLANDWEPYSHEIALGTVGLNRRPPFAALGGAEAAFGALNSLPPVRGYVARHLCPADDASPDPERERLFFTRANGERIDAVRERIAAWESSGAIDRAERAYLLSALLYRVSYVSNTSGVFKAFHRGWGGRTATALYRIRSVLTLRPPVLLDNGLANPCTRRDAQALAGELPDVLGGRPDVVYLDPPYNQHPYGSNYHVLNTVVLWDKPPVNPSIRVNGRTVDKSAIRTDWRTRRRSPYNHAAHALPALRTLLGRLDARWILMSYSTDGNMPAAAVLRALGERGRLRLLTRTYKRYRVSTPRKSPRGHNVEFLAVVDTGSPPQPARAAALAERLARREWRAPSSARPE